MELFNRALVALDLSDMDRRLMSFSARMASLLDMQKLYFLHVMPDFTMPKNIDVEFQKLFAPEYPVDERVRDKIALDVQEAFAGLPRVDLSVEVVEGKPYDKLLHWTEVKEIDLLIVGHKEQSEGSGITPRRVARRSDCNVLFVPPEAPDELRHLLVPIDFSDNSLRALQTAIDLKRRLLDADVRCLYVVDLPPSDYYMRPFDNSGYRQMLLDAARHAYQNFLAENKLPAGELLEPAFIPNDYSNIAVHVAEYADQEAIDLVVVGAQGHSALEHFIFGSVTEKLVEKCRKKPVLIVR